MKRIFYLFLFLPFALTSQNTVVDIVVNSPDHNTLETAVLAAGLETTLSSTGPFTVFAPTDAAFAALPATVINTLLADPQGALTDVLTYHVVGGDIRSTDLSDGQTAMTVNGLDITVKIENGNVFINDAQVTTADIVADNGVVHVIDAVLIPEPATVVDIIVDSPIHNTLETAVLAAGLETTLSEAGPFTVFAPTDAAFDALPAAIIDALLSDPQGALTDVLTYHVIAGADVRSTDLSDGQMAMTVNGQEITVKIENGNVFIDDAQVLVADIVAGNGVVHVIDAVLLPKPPTVVDIVVNSPIHNTLEAAVIAADLAGTLSEDGPFTLFAPTDAAFDALPDGTIDALLADPSGDLTSILLYHAVSGDIRSTDLSDGQVATTVNGKDIVVKIENGNVFINDAQVVLADIEASNGVVHVIDAVLLPPTTTVVDIIVNSPDHNTLEAAVVAADLAGTLSGDGPFTVFAPTDAAFDALPDGTIDALLADPSGDLTSILLYHVIGGDIRSTDLSDGQMAATLNGKDITVRIDDGNVFINDAMVTAADIVTDNGVVHVIDAVLLPPTRTVVDVIVDSPDHNTLEAAVIAADLAGTLAGDGPFTVFAPTDAAFDALPAGTVDALLADPSGDLTSILLYHVIGADVRSTDLSDGQMAATLNGSEITVKIENGNVFINDAQVVVADLVTDNGVVHVIDAVLLPTTSSTEELGNFSDARIFPNPSQGIINIELAQEDTGNTMINIINSAGQRINSQVISSSNTTLDMNDVNNGLYILEITNQNKKYYKKVMIEK